MHFCVFRLFIITLTTLMLGCSDQPKQIADRDAIVPNPASPSTPVTQDEVDSFDGEEGKPVIIDNIIGREPTEIREPRVGENNSEDDKIEKNGKQPIVFDGINPLESSVAGVKFNSSYSDASEILSTPYVGACGGSGDYYLENLCLLWSSEEPRRLRQALILDGYLGAINLPEPLGKVTMKAELQDVFKPEFGDLGEVLLQKTYNEFFGKESSYSCVETKECQALLYNDFINWILPNITIVFSKDRKVLVQMVINQDVQPGDFASPLDLVLGGINVKETGEMLMLGEKWGDVQAKLSRPANPAAFLETKAYRKDFVGSVARVQRAGIYNDVESFNLESKTESKEDIFSNFLVYSNYQAPIMLNGKYLVLRKDVEGKFKLKLVSYEPTSVPLSTEISENSTEKTFTVRMDELAGDLKAQKEVLKDLARLMRKEFKSVSENSVVSQRFSGFHARPAANRRMVLRTSFYDFDKMKGLFVYTHVSVNSGSFLFSIALDNDPMSSVSMASVKESVDLTSNSLAGFRLGQKVKLIDIDRSRNEGFLSLGENTVRVELDLYASANVSYEEDSVSKQNIIEVSGVSGAVLGLSPLSSIDQDTTELEAELTYISSSLNDKGIKGVCGSDKLFKVGMTQRAFEKNLKKLVKELKSENKNITCSPFVGPDQAGDGEARVVYFPNQGTRVYFSERVLTGVSKYKKASGGNQ